MTTSKGPHDKGVQIEADIPFTRREWYVQRVAWAGMALVLAAGLLGGFGRGPMSSASVRAGGLVVEYERFPRHGAPEQLRIRVEPGAARTSGSGPEAGLVRVWLPRHLVDRVEMSAISPEPESAATSSERVTYAFRAAPSRPTVVSFRFRPDGYWLRRLQVGVEGGPTVEATQFIYP